MSMTPHNNPSDAPSDAPSNTFSDGSTSPTSPTSPLDPMPYRAEFPITERYAFLSHAAVSPLNTRAADAVQRHLTRVQQEPFTAIYSEFMTLQQELRERLNTLINARGIDEIALMPNTATGLNTAAVSLPLTVGDNVLVLDGDYPANIYPWFNLSYKGVLTKVVPQRDGGLDLDVLEQRIDRRTRVIALSTAMFATGFRNDIAAVGRLCRERGIFFVVDGIQSLGAFPMDVQEYHIDMLSAGSQKWLLSVPGSGFLYCRRELLDYLVPGAYVGASSVVDPMNYLDYNLTPPHSAERFHTGSPNFLGMTALNATLGMLLEIGIERINERVLHLVDIFLRDMEQRGYQCAASTLPQHRSGIVIVRHPNAEEVCNYMSNEGVIATARGEGIRIAPHFYNTEEELLRVGKLLDHYRETT